MNKAIGIVLFVVGTALIVYGMQASDSVSSGVSRLLAGAPTNRTLALLLGGAASSILGLFMTFRSRRA